MPDANLAPWWLPSATALFIAIIAIWQEQIRRILFGARLTVVFDAATLADSHITTLTLKWDDGARQRTSTIPTFWVRVRVANTGKTSAHDVRLIAVSLWMKSRRGRYERDPKFTSLNLKWANLGTATLHTLPAGIEQHCDLFHIPDPSRTIPEGYTETPPRRTQGFLETEVHPNYRPGTLGAGHYKLELISVASDARPRRLFVEFAIPEVWVSDDRAMQRIVNLQGLDTTAFDPPLFPEYYE